MDADIYGPSLPRMMGASGVLTTQEGKIVPIRAHGLDMVSMGFVVEGAKPVIWRGPLTDKLIRQFMGDVNWGELDLLVVDMPPGTGDIALSVGNALQPEGAVVVVTPQAVAVDDARKAAAMLGKQNIPIVEETPPCHASYPLVFCCSCSPCPPVRWLRQRTTRRRPPNHPSA